MTLEGVTRDRDDAVFRRVDIVVGWWIPTRSATPSTALVPQRKVGFPIPNAHLLLGFQGTKTARREGISSPFSDAGGCTSPQNSGVPPLGSVHRGCKHRSSALTTGSNLEYCDAILSQPRCRFRLLIANYMPASGYCRSSVTCLGCKSCQLSSRKTNQGQTPEFVLINYNRHRSPVLKDQILDLGNSMHPCSRSKLSTSARESPHRRSSPSNIFPQATSTRGG